MKQNKLMQLVKDNVRPLDVGIRSDISAESADIYVYDVIDGFFGVGANDLIAALAEAGGKPINMHINSPGGDVFEARAMAAAIAGYSGKVTAVIDGVAASAATYIALAASEVRMTDGGLFMVHNSWTMAMGDHRDLAETAALLQKIDSTINKTYADKTGATPEQVTAWMDAETWFTAEEAIAAGFIDSVEPSTQASKNLATSWNLTAYAHAPAPAPAPTPDPQALFEGQRQTNTNRMRLLMQNRI